MGFLKQKKSHGSPQTEGRADISSSQDPQLPTDSSSTDHPDDMPDASLIGRKIKLVRAEDWQQDLIQSPPKETFILYENQRGYPPLIPNVACFSGGSRISAPIRSCGPSISILPRINALIHS